MPSSMLRMLAAKKLHGLALYMHFDLAYVIRRRRSKPYGLPSLRLRTLWVLAARPVIFQPWTCSMLCVVCWLYTHRNLGLEGNV